MAKRCNEKRVTAQAVEWGKRGACLNDIAPGIIVTPLALDEFNGPRGDFYKNMFATLEEVALVADVGDAPHQARLLNVAQLCAADGHRAGVALVSTHQSAEIVDLPQPDSPTSETNLPCGIVRSTPCRISRSGS